MNLLFSRSAFTARFVQLSRHFRAALALSLMLAVFLTPLCLNVSAQTPSSSLTEEYDHYMIYQGEDGDTICREATALERRELERIVPKNLRQINHTGENAMALATPSDNDVTHLTIILRATSQLEQNPEAKAAFIRAAAAWENVVTSPVTIYLDADYGAKNFGADWPSGVLGSTSSPSLSSATYSGVRNNLIAGANTAEKSTIYNLLPANSVPTDTGNTSFVSVSSSIARAIGLLNATAQPTDNAARIGFNSAILFDFNRTDGIDSDRFDFEAIAIHEIGHALGFTSRSGASGSQPITPSMWDLYRFRSGTTSATFTTAQRIMTIGGPTTNSQYFFVPGQTQLGLSDGGPSGSTDNNADGNQSSHWRQRSKNGNVLIGIMDPRIPPGTRRDIMPADTNALNIFGYNSNTVAPPPPPPAPPNNNFVAAQAISGCSGSVSGTNIGATRETGEPNHSPDGRGGIHSIWYRWEAPATGIVTIDTIGSGFDTVLAVYTENSLSSLSVGFKNDDIDPGVVTNSRVTFPVTAGLTYRIAVDGFNNTGTDSGEVGPVTLNWNLSNCSGSWSPTVLAANQVELKSWTRTGRTSIYVKLTFPDAGYRVTNWGTPARAGDAFTVGTTVEKFSGVSAQAISNTAQIWDLGVLTAGNYTFAFRNSGTTVKTLNFTVSSTVPPPNPIDDAREFVRWQYKDFLRREPDGPGWDHWTGEITQCSNSAFRRPGETEAQCVERKRENTSAAFFVSPEFQNTGYFVLRVYRGSLGRMPHFGGTGSANDEFTRDAATVGQGIVVNNALSPSVINANKQAFVNQFVTRADFRAIYDALNNTQYVDRLFQMTSVAPTSADRLALINGLNGGSETRASVLFKVVDGTTTTTGGQLTFNTTYGKAFYDNLFNAAFVQMEYFGYLQRDPDDGGYSFWLGKLNGFGDWVNAEMVKAFINSPEYRARFGAP
jgi:hypothetical protein